MKLIIWQALIFSTVLTIAAEANPALGQQTRPVNFVFTDQADVSIEETLFEEVPGNQQANKAGSKRVQDALQMRILRPLFEINLERGTNEPQPIRERWNPGIPPEETNLQRSVPVRLSTPEIVIKNPLFAQPSQEIFGYQPDRPTIVSGLKFWRDTFLFPSRVLFREHRNCERVNVVGQPEMCYRR